MGITDTDREQTFRWLIRQDLHTKHAWMRRHPGEAKECLEAFKRVHQIPTGPPPT